MNENEMRELDAWIAERVTNRGNGPYYCSVCRECVPIASVTSGGYHEKCSGKVDFGIPCYSNNPADALAVLEKCAEKQGRIDSIHIGKAHDGWWQVHSMDYEGTSETHMAAHVGDGKTLPLAICLFAKKLFS